MKEEIEKQVRSFLDLAKSKNKQYTQSDLDELIELGSPARLYFFNGGSIEHKLVSEVEEQLFFGFVCCTLRYA